MASARTRSSGSGAHLSPTSSAYGSSRQLGSPVGTRLSGSGYRDPESGGSYSRPGSPSMTSASGSRMPTMTSMASRESMQDSLIREPPRTKHGFLQRMFLRHHNEHFADRMEYTFRATLCVVAMALPFILPEGSMPSVEAYVESGLLSRNTILMFILTIDLTVAETMSNATSGLLGVLIAFCNTSMLRSVYPDGFNSITVPFMQAAIVAHCLMLTWMVLWLNFGMNTRIFCLMNLSYEFMDFINPGTSWCDERSYCTPISVQQAAVSCAVAVLASLLPTPKLALRKARSDAKDISAALVRASLDVGATYCGAHTAEYRQDRLMADLQMIRTQMLSFEHHYMVSWYEFGWVIWVKSGRMHLGRLQRTMQEWSDRLLCMWNVSTKRFHNQMHDDFMMDLWPDVFKVLSESTRLLMKCQQCACDARLPSPQDDGLSTEVSHLLTSLTEKFKQKRRQVTSDGLIEELVDEQCFLVHVCAMARLAEDLAMDLRKHHSNSDNPLAMADKPSGITDWTALGNAVHLNFAVRGLITIALAFAAGYLGHSKMMMEYDAGAAAVAALLLRKSVGSAHSRNLQRLRGVGIGTVGGAVLYSMFGWCTPGSHFLTCCSIACWVGAAFLHHASGPYGSMTHEIISGSAASFGKPGTSVVDISGGASAGLLSAYFGARAMSERCVSEVFSEVDVFGVSFDRFVPNLTAVFICFVVDYFLAPDTSAELACKAYDQAWKSVSTALKNALDPNNDERPHSAETMRKIRVAEALGQQASMESRHWRRPWPTLIYGDAVDTLSKLRMTLCGLEFAINVNDEGRSTGKAEKARRLTRLEWFKPVRRLLEESLDKVGFAMQNVLEQETGLSLKALAHKDWQRRFLDELVVALRAFEKEAGTLADFKDQSPARTLETDVSALCSVIISCSASIVSEAQSLQTALMRPIF